jgi:Trypsin-co-occurring domain 1
MAKRLVEFPLEDGGTVLVQAEDGTAAGGHGGGEVTRGWGDRDERLVLQAQQSFEQAVGRVQPAVQALVRRLRSVAESPEEIKVDFGLELSAEVGAFVAGASSTGNFTVSMTWRPERAAEPVPGAAESSPDDEADEAPG